jgi:hypothetical protein
VSGPGVTMTTAANTMKPRKCDIEDIIQLSTAGVFSWRMSSARTTLRQPQLRSAKGFDGRASPDDNAAFAAVAFRDVEAHRGLEASWD